MNQEEIKVRRKKESLKRIIEQKKMSVEQQIVFLIERIAVLEVAKEESDNLRVTMAKMGL